jgi:hypothetical protein
VLDELGGAEEDLAEAHEADAGAEEVALESGAHGGFDAGEVVALVELGGGERGDVLREHALDLGEEGGLQVGRAVDAREVEEGAGEVLEEVGAVGLDGDREADGALHGEAVLGAEVRERVAHGDVAAFDEDEVEAARGLLAGSEEADGAVGVEGEAGGVLGDDEALAEEAVEVGGGDFERDEGAVDQKVLKGRLRHGDGISSRAPQGYTPVAGGRKAAVRAASESARSCPGMAWKAFSLVHLCIVSGTENGRLLTYILTTEAH